MSTTVTLHAFTPGASVKYGRYNPQELEEYYKKTGAWWKENPTARPTRENGYPPPDFRWEEVEGPLTTEDVLDFLTPSVPSHRSDEWYGETFAKIRMGLDSFELWDDDGNFPSEEGPERKLLWWLRIWTNRLGVIDDGHALALIDYLKEIGLDMPVDYGNGEGNYEVTLAEWFRQNVGKRLFLVSW